MVSDAACARAHAEVDARTTERVDSALDVSTRHVRIGLLLADYMDKIEWMQDLTDKWGSHDTWFRDFFCVNVPDAYYNTPTSRVHVSITHFDCWSQQLPTTEDLADLDCCIITGSRNAAYETHPWILHLAEWIRTHHTKTKLIGFCFGHQIINQALGGSVTVNPQGIEEGTATISLAPAFHRIFKTEKLAMRLCLGHQDYVETPIPSGEVLGSTDRCAVQGVSYGETVLTFQPHPEILAGAMIDMLDRRWENLAKSKEMYTNGEVMSADTYAALRDDLSDAVDRGVDDLWVGAKILGWIMDDVEGDEVLMQRRARIEASKGEK
ncbi:class I glutamine amidotransferase-like protein [Gonapodya prolifera JEL478]|uniref:Class I glutamine amidotransferase-like protein n=1 Tax=Gonapodya prolifera (strain JEL478) TaxID=1344416 RepID=A0A138ZXM3_GONPJ|nr:class I glutamine amidotransferase-like protein [Gonapodya prolifera JEL478]|eukprot:KXS09234.1 class I glutamine amidotransferase-like protein [Gonapodya prolifera JEL478]